MPVYLFAGPTLTREHVHAALPAALLLPPAAQGDVYRAAKHGLRAPGVTVIALVDGYFERMPSVWHKEILWAMQQGVHVCGAASMGALRAAELAAFGMVGVGAIYAAYASGQLEDDDEVAVAHAPAEDGFRPLSVAMVDIRATLGAAWQAGVLRQAAVETLGTLAKGLFYPQRTYPRLIQQAAEQGADRDELAAFRAWLPAGRVDLKQQDALALLASVRDLLAANPAPKQVSFTFQHTEVWDSAARTAGELHLPPDDTGTAGTAAASTLLLDTLLDELRLSGGYPPALQAALLRALLLEDARRQGLTLSAEALQAAADAFRQERALHSGADVDRWSAEQQLDRSALTRLLRDEALQQTAAALAQGQALRRLPDTLRVQGAYARLAARARHKQALLAAHGLENPALADAGLSEDALWRWCFSTLAALPAPPAADAAALLEHTAAFARQVGLDPDDLRRVVLREYCYRQLVPPTAPAGAAQA